MMNPQWRIFIILNILVFFGAAGCAGRAETENCLVTVDINKAQKEISRGIFGFNLEWIEDGNFVWDVRNNSPDSALLQEIAGLKPAILRFPGGVFSDFYHWREAIGPRNARVKKQPSPFDGRLFNNSFGTDEFLDVCREVGALPLITVNVGTSTSAEAADWVRYCNISSPSKRVALWELGNELYINSDKATRSISLPPGKYAEKVNEFSLAMKKADPSIKTAAIGGANTGLYKINQYARWDETVLKTSGRNIDYLAVHNAYYPAVWDSNNYTTREIYMSLLGANSLIEANIGMLNKEIAAYAPLYKDKIKIAVTEWGPLFAWSPDSPFREQTYSLGSALYVALALKTFITSDNVEIANFFKLSGSDFMAFLQGKNKYPPYYAFQMFSVDFGDTLVETICEAPEYSTEKRIGLIGPLNRIPLLEAVASKDAQGGVYVIVINKDLEKGRGCAINFAGSPAKINGTVSILTGSDVGTKEAEIQENEISGEGRVNFIIPAHSIAKLKLKISK